MKRAIIILTMTFITNVAVSQTKKYHEAYSIFKENYNTGNFDSIFNRFSTEMQNSLPIEKTKYFFEDLKLQAGNIIEEAFIKFENESFAVYKTTFDKALLTVNISLNENNLINGIYIKPYTEEIISTRINGITSFPSNISKSIFSLTNNFPDNTQLSIAILKKGDVKYYGVIIENDTIKSIKNQNKIFEIGSLSKIFTSTVLASLIIDNKLKLDDSINDYYPFLFKNNTKINFLDLANHTSGLPRLPENLDLTNEANPYKNYTKKELDKYLKEFLKFKNSTIKQYEYSNLGAGLLSNALGLSQKKSYIRLLKHIIFKKYNMQNTFTSIEETENIVKGLDEKGLEVPNWEFDVLIGSGGILSTTEDLVKFAQAQFNKKNKELALTRIPTFSINNNMKIGLGWHILKSEKDFNWIWHNGGTRGYSSSMVLNVKNKNGVIILSNVSAFNSKMENVDKLCFELMNQAENYK